ncbi:MAG: hypothetical protein R3Y09_09860 [Clostridia bacterium]
MTNAEIFKMIEDTKIIAIARGVKPNEAVNLAKALYDGGIRMLEFAFDMKNPECTDTDECIKAVAEAMDGKMCVGSGTLRYRSSKTRNRTNDSKFT